MFICPYSIFIKIGAEKTFRPADVRENLSFDNLLSVRAYSDHTDRAFAKFFKTCDILAAYLGKLLKLSASGEILGEAGEFLVNRLAALKSLKRGGEVSDNRAVGLFVCYANFECVKTCESVKLVDNERGKSVYTNSVADDNRVEPACSSGSACDSAELAALVADIVACFVVKLSGERTLAHSCGVCLCNAVDSVNCHRTYARTCANACGQGVGGGNIRVCSEVDVKESCLSTLEENGLACLLSLIGKNGNIVHILCKTLTIADIFLDSLFDVDSFAAIYLCDDSIFQLANALGLFSENVGVNEIIETETASLVLVHISGTDTSVSCTNVLAASELLGKTVKSDMPGHNDVSSGVDLQVVKGNSSCGKGVYLAKEVLGVENYACSDKAECIFIKNTRGDKMKLVSFAAAGNGVTCIVSALCTDYNISTGSKDINYLSLALVAPLGADYDICRHY